MIQLNRTVVLFVIATWSLLAGGIFLRNIWNWEEFAAMVYIGTCGTILVYGINLAKFTYAHYLGILKASIRNPLQGIFLLQMIPVVPWAVKQTTPFGIAVFLTVFGCGLLYALQVKFFGKYLQVKRFALLKNTFIGFAWGALILVGAGTWDNDLVRMVFLFASLQILNGSVIRDVSDIELDKQQGVRTLPVLYGTKSTFRILHAIFAHCRFFMVQNRPSGFFMRLIYSRSYVCFW